MQTLKSFRLILLSLFIGTGLLISGCAQDATDEDEVESVRRSGLTPAEDAKRLFERGEYMMNAGNFDAAVQMFEVLETRYPLSEHTRQSQINLIYSYYKRKRIELAVDAANQFILENPVHPKLDYVYYILGLVHFDEENDRIENLIKVDKSKRPQSQAQDSLEYFQTLIQKFPASDYAADAKQRIIFLRERLAQHEMQVASYYARRGIHVAAVNRAKIVLEDYPDTNAARQALVVLENSYRGMGLNDLADDTRRVRESN